MKFVAGLTCHLCGATYPSEALWVCSECMGPLEVTYDYAAISKVISRAAIESRPPSLWRYLELLPVEEILGAAGVVRDGNAFKVLEAEELSENQARVRRQLFR